MKINSIRIIDHSSLEEIGVLSHDNDILEVFKTYGGISFNDIFEFKDSVYVTEEIVMKLVNEGFEIQVLSKFLQLIADVPEKL